MKYLFIAAAVFLGGCSMKEAAPMKVYTLATPSVTPASYGQYRNKILKVSYPIALKEKLTDGISYSYTETDRGEYMNSRWSNNAGRLLQGSMIQLLTQSRLFKVVLPFSSDVEENLRLESTIFDFSHHVRGEASYAVFSVQCTLMNAETGKLIKAKRFTYREATTTKDARGYVEAVNRIMAKFGRDMTHWLR